MSAVVWTHPPLGSTTYETSLMSRMGGVEVIKEYVKGLYDNMLKDAAIGAMLKAWMQTAPHDFYMQHLKDRTVDYLEVVWGGEPWEGQDLFKAHMHLRINPKTFDKCIKCGKAKLNTMKLSSGIKKEIMDQMEIMKEPITDPDENFRKWIMKRNEEMEARAQAQAQEEGEGMTVNVMGFAASPTMVKAMAAKAKLEQDRKDRLAAQKKERLAAQKEKENAKAKATEGVGNGTKPEKAPERSKAKPKAATGTKKKVLDAGTQPKEKAREKDPADKGTVSTQEVSVDPHIESASTQASASDDIPPLPEDGLSGYVPESLAVKIGLVHI